MARKDLLKSLMSEATSPKPQESLPRTEPAAPTPGPRYSKGAIGAVSASIAQLKSRAIEEIDPNLISSGGLVDRLGEDDDHESLKASIQEYGQQVPVLLRHDPAEQGRYQIVYGRRRVAALQALNLPVKAMIRDMKDDDLIIAQGQENAARRDLTFIEKANFARQMRDHGFERKVICDALHIDKTVISRMLSVADALPLPLVMAIGPAPAAGRDRWRLLADRYAERGDEAALTRYLETSTDPSDAKFDAVLERLAEPRAPKPATTDQVLTDEKSQTIGRARKTGRKTVLSFDAKEADGFDDWLIDQMTELHRQYISSRR
ncbi:plasmid partitioning protein RepB [Pseudooceanicola sp. C21-150M6]|uniref:plasmid partitioning protein RepB n=1 Tax=Pseudooceanicola sp. C21-150M6 TaxID=3434355 RepID=UPI003D7FF87D